MTNDQKVVKLVNRRIFLILIGQLSFFGILIYRLFNLQIVRHKEYLTLAENNQYRVVVEPVSRGLILDSNDKVLAENVVEYLLILDSKKTNDIENFILKMYLFLRPFYIRGLVVEIFVFT